MKLNQKEYQYFACVENQLVQHFLDILDTEDALSLGIRRDSSVKIIKSSDTNKKLLPLNFRDIISIENLIALLRKLTNIEIDIIKLPWDEKWAQATQISNLHERLKQLLNPKILEFIPKTFDLIGSVAILEIDRWGELSEIIQNTSELTQILSIVGEAIINLHKNISTVLNKMGNIKGEFRLREYQVIAGEPCTYTIHKENNCVFHVDPIRMFFSPRLSFERNRVANLFYNKHAIILDIFAGIGPFSIQIARNHEVQVYSIEKNPDAYKFLEKNITSNKNLLKGTIHPYLGDFREFLKSTLGKNCINKTDYIIMNLPELSHEFLPYILPFVRRRKTTLIYYTFIHSRNPLEDALVQFEEAMRENRMDIVNILQKRVVFSYSPTQNNVGIDADIRKV